jgi:transcriptional regulator with XRE-family HTH domain
VAVDNRNEIRQFLTSRRARITPEQAGLPIYGGNRRVAGLRREEVALLAGVSVDYYTRLERGNLGGVSEAVLDALAQALQLDEAERGHLFDLARAANTSARPRRRPAQQRARPGVQRILDAITDTPADLRNGRRDILAANRLGYALYSELYIDPVRPANVARFVFLSPAPVRSFPTGRAPPTTWWPACALRPAAIPMTGGCRIWSGNCPPAARSSAAGGRPITCACTRPAASACITRSSGTSS